MKKYMLIVLSVIVVFAVFQYNPLRNDNKVIEKMIFERIPYQTDFTVAKRIIDESGWDVEYIDMKNGYELYDEHGVTIVGEKYICVYLGSYRNFFVTDVSALLIFDDKSKLMQVVIRKDTDGL